MPRPPQTEQQRAEVRKRIVASVKKLLDDKGVEAVSMRAVGKAVGLSASALYEYFNDKDEMVKALWRTAYDDLTAKMQAISDANDDPVSALREFAAAYTEFALEDPVRFRMLFLQRGKTDQSTDPHPAYRLLRSRVEEAMVRRKIKPDDPDLAAQALWAAVHGPLVLLVQGTGFPSCSPELLVLTIRDFVLSGLENSSADSPSTAKMRRAMPRKTKPSPSYAR
jgi:AcrR family transcriptional regulator